MVRGLRLSIPASRMRLKDIATDLAATMATIISGNFTHSAGAKPHSRQASSAPVSANGRANTECSNLIISSVSRVFRQKELSSKLLPFYFMLRAVSLALLIALAAAGCKQSDPVRDFSSTEVTLPNGKVLLCEVESTEVDMARGMMFRDSLPEGRGMLFLHSKPGKYPYWSIT